MVLGTLAGVGAGLAEAQGRLAADVERRGYPRPAFLAGVDSVEYYFVEARYDEVWLAAIHQADAGTPVIDARRRGDTWRLGPATLAQFRSIAGPEVTARWPDARIVRVNHHVAGVYFDTDADRRQDRAGTGLKNDWHPARGAGLIDPPLAGTVYRIRAGQWTYDADEVVASALAVSVERERARRTRLSGAIEAGADEARRDIEAARERVLSLERGRREAAVRRGLAYLSPVHWFSYEDPEVMVRLFEGDFGFRQLQAVRAELLEYWVYQFDRQCQGSFPPNPPSYTIRRWYERDGVPVRRAPGDSTKVRVVPALAAIYEDHWESRRLPSAETFADLMSGRIPRGLLLTGEFIQRNGCTGPAIDQMVENLRRIELELPSLQAAGVGIGASPSRSDPVEGRPSDRTLGAACWAHGAYAESRRPWCQCLERDLRPAMTPDEYDRYRADFGTLLSEVDRIPGRGTAGPPRRLADPLNACRR